MMPVPTTVEYTWVVICVIQVTSSRVWQTMYLDDEQSCHSYIHNDDMAEGDVYVIMSDSYQGGSHWSRKPAECSTNFNLGDRILAVHMREWWCDVGREEPFLAIYDDCKGRRLNLLGWFNCTSDTPVLVKSATPCVSLYHYRGHTSFGYFFSLQVTATYEVMPFPAGGFAAVIMLSLVTVLVIVKILCVVYDWRHKGADEVECGASEAQVMLPRHPPSRPRGGPRSSTARLAEDSAEAVSSQEEDNAVISSPVHLMHYTSHRSSPSHVIPELKTEPGSSRGTSHRPALLPSGDYCEVTLCSNTDTELSQQRESDNH